MTPTLSVLSSEDDELEEPLHAANKTVDVKATLANPNNFFNFIDMSSFILISVFILSYLILVFKLLLIRFSYSLKL